MQRDRKFEELYLSSYELVYNYISYRMAGDDAVEDVVAEAYLLAARNFNVYDPSRSKFSTWVISIAVNAMNSHYRKHKPTTVLDDAPQTSFAVDGEQSSVDDRELIVRLLNVLDPESRALVYMKYYEGKRNVDIARELGMNASTISTKLASSLAKMRAAAEAMGD